MFQVLRAQVEVSQIRSEIEKRIQEKEEEFENTRKNHQRALESMQASETFDYIIIIVVITIIVIIESSCQDSVSSCVYRIAKYYWL